MRIRWTRPAASDLTQICDYIEKHGSAATARRVALSIYQHVVTLAEFPERGRTGRRPDTRELVFTLPCRLPHRRRWGGDPPNSARCARVAVREVEAGFGDQISVISSRFSDFRVG
jgi:plasmid stabilization system protein ParE